MSTRIQANHCSMYLRASIHIPTMLNAVVKLSSHGTLLSVYSDKYPGDADERQDKHKE